MVDIYILLIFLCSEKRPIQFIQIQCEQASQKISSQARGRIRAAATGLCHSYSNRVPAASATYTAAHGNANPLTCWARPGMEPESSLVISLVCYHWATAEKKSDFFSLLKFMVIMKFLHIRWLKIFSFSIFRIFNVTGLKLSLANFCCVLLLQWAFSDLKQIHKLKVDF